uniref:Uncharacterized protein n=1 Tax=Gopherus evgoodei TaxID=1825980 RepID=A0A8C5EZX0_9SAUR
MFSYTYSAWKGRNLYIDNLYVQPQFRGTAGPSPGGEPRRPGSQSPLHSNPPEKDFLARRGGEDLTAKEGWSLFHLEEDALRRLAAQSTI